MTLSHDDSTINIILLIIIIIIINPQYKYDKYSRDCTPGIEM